MFNHAGAPWADIIEDVRWYPSPHNSQPIKLRAISETTARIYYDLDLGLPAESFGIPFGYVCAGVFLESLSVVAAARGYRTIESLDHSKINSDAADRLHPIGTVRLEPAADDPGTRSAAQRRLAAFHSRQTSRRPCDSRIVGDEILAAASSVAAGQGFRFRSTADARLVSTLVPGKLQN